MFIQRYGWGILELETQYIFDAMTDRPSSVLGQAMNNLIVSLKASGWWDEIGYLLVPTLHTEQASLLNWKNPGLNTAVNNGCAFVPFQGFSGDAVADYIDTIAPTSVSGYAQDTAHQFVWAEDGTGTSYAVGTAAGGSSSLMAIAPDGGGTIVTKNNRDQNGLPGSGASRDGLFHHIRTVAGNYNVYFSGGLVANVAQASAATQPAVSTLLRSGVGYNDDRIMAYGIGGNVTSTPSDLFDALSTFYTAIGTVFTP